MPWYFRLALTAVVLGTSLAGLASPGRAAAACASPSFGPSTVVSNRALGSAVAGDFNGDGKLDLAVANFHGNEVAILLGDGHGGFSPPTQFQVGTEPISIAVGDFNRDGRLDLAVANQGSGSVSILLGDGHGGFSGPTNHPTGD